MISNKVAVTKTNFGVSRRKKLFFAGAATLFAIVLSGVGLEIYARARHPELAPLVHVVEIDHPTRIFANPKNFTTTGIHPDTEERFPVVYNSFGNRQHREFSRDKAPGVIRVCELGDSFAENRQMRVEYSFTEPLDYALNAAGNPRGKKFEVLNFGNERYGIDQELLRYLEEVSGLDCDIVVYVASQNDLWNITTNHLFDLQAVETNGRKRQGLVDARADLPWRKKFILYNIFRPLSRISFAFHLIRKGFAGSLGWDFADMLRREQMTIGKIDQPEYDKEIEIFTRLLRIFQGRVESNGAKFFAFVTPCDYRIIYNNNNIIQVFRGLHVDYLAPIISFENAHHPRYRFEWDGHWDEEGNKVAAETSAEKILSIEEIHHSEAEIGSALLEYYCSFNRRFPWLGACPVVSEDTRKRIDDKYLALEQHATTSQQR